MESLFKNYLGKGLVLSSCIMFLVYIMGELKFPAWAAFFTANMCVLAGASIDEVLAVSVTHIIGILMAFGMFYAIPQFAHMGAIGPSLAIGLVSLPVFFLEKNKYTGMIPSIFNGVAIFFALGKPPSLGAFSVLTFCVVIGSVWAFVVGQFMGWYAGKFLTPAEQQPPAPAAAPVKNEAGKAKLKVVDDNGPYADVG